MKTATLLLALLALFPAVGAMAAAADSGPSITTHGCDPPARWASRRDPRSARLAITSEDGDTNLLLTDEFVAVQLSDRTLRDARRELRRQEDEEDNALARAFMAVVLSGVRALLDHSAECSIRDLRDVDYSDGRLRFTAECGRRLFDDFDVNGRDVLESFSERDARAFVREFHRLKAHPR